MEDGIAILGVTPARNLAELLGNGVPLAQNQARKDRLVELLVKRELAGEEAAIQGGQCELEISGIKPACFVDGPGTWACPEADIPHSLNDRSDGLFSLLLCLRVSEGEQDVD